MGFWKTVRGIIKGLIPGYESGARIEYLESRVDFQQQKIQIEKQKLDQTREVREKEQQEFYEKQKQLSTNNYFLNNTWPLLMPPDFMPLRKNQRGVIVMRVILAESNNENFQNTLGNCIKNRLHSILTEYFSENSEHPINFYFDGWKKDHGGGAPSLDALYQILRGQPTLVIMPIISDYGETLLLRTAFWGIGMAEESPMCIDFVKIPLGRIKRDVSREFAKQWRDFKRKIGNSINLNSFNTIDQKNLELLEQEESLIAKGIGISEIECRTDLYYNYQIDDRRLNEDTVSYLVSVTEAAISYISDIYYLIEYNEKPITPYILSTLQHPSYLPAVAQQILPLYKASSNIIDISGTKNQFLDIESYSLPELTDRITYIMKVSKCCPRQIKIEYCALRLIWDEKLSEYLRSWLGVQRIQNSKIQAVAEYVYTLLVDIDSTIIKDSVYQFMCKLIEDINKESIIFAIVSRYALIKEFIQFAQKASYQIYLILKTEGGINWLIAYKLADHIYNTILDSNKLLTTSMYIERSKKELIKVLLNILKELKLQYDKQNIEICIGDGILLENLRRMADVFLEFNRPDYNYINVSNDNVI